MNCSSLSIWPRGFRMQAPATAADLPVTGRLLQGGFRQVALTACSQAARKVAASTPIPASARPCSSASDANSPV